MALRRATQFATPATRVKQFLGSRAASTTATTTSPETNLAGVLALMGETALPPAPSPGGMYVPTVLADNYLYVSGHPPLDAQGDKILGICYHTDDEAASAEMVATAKRAAAHNALAILATVRTQLGSLDRVRRVVKSLCMVNTCTSPEFAAWRGDGPPPVGFQFHPEVMNGYSEVMAEVFGHDNGIGARSAVGMNLPHGIATEVEVIFELKD